MSKLVPPHGSNVLIPLLAPEAEIPGELSRAATLRKVPMSSRETSDFIMLAMGAYTPLEGFMSKADWHGVCAEMKTASGLFWPIPITLSATRELADSIAVGETVTLTDQDSGEIMGMLEVSEKYALGKEDKEFECQHIFRTTDPKHPGVEKVMGQAEVNLAGRVTALSEGVYPKQYKGFYYRPAETRALFTEKGWSRVAAFQTRNPMHRSHEHLAKIAIEICDGVLIHQVLGALKPGDIPAETRVEGHRQTDRELFRSGHLYPGGLPHRDALCRSARGAAACRVPAEFRLLAPRHRPRSRGRWQLLRAVRRAAHLRHLAGG